MHETVGVFMANIMLEAQVLRQMSRDAVEALTDRLAGRLGVPASTLFPALPALRGLLAPAA